MTAQIVRLNSEDPAAFIKRNGPTLTREVAYRFGLEMDAALAWLKRLERAGAIKGRRVAITRAGSGAGYEWTAA